MPGEIERCPVEVHEPPGYWHSHICDKTAKFEIVDRNGDKHKVCGIHRRANERYPLPGDCFKGEHR